MQAATKKMFLATVLCTLAMPALAHDVANNGQRTAGEAANLEKKETSVDAEVHPANSHQLTAASAHKNHVATTHPKAAVVHQTRAQQHSTATLKTGLQTKQTALHRETREDSDGNGGAPAPGEKTKVNQQSKASNDIRVKKHNARMF